MCYLKVLSVPWNCQGYGAGAPQSCVYPDIGRGIYLFCSASMGLGGKERPLMLWILSPLCEFALGNIYPPLANYIRLTVAFLKLVGVCILKIFLKCFSILQQLISREIRLVIPKLQVDAAKDLSLYHQLVTPATGHIWHL